MKKFIALLVLIFLFSAGSANAQSGCCSWHGGVCGSRCCDGSALSAKCAPYYPAYVAPTVKKPAITKPVVKPIVIPKPVLMEKFELRPSRHYAPAMSMKRVFKTTDNFTVWELSDWQWQNWGTRKAFSTEASFLGRGYDWSDIKIISQTELEKYTAGFGNYY